MEEGDELNTTKVKGQ